MTDSTRAAFEAWWDSEREANDGIAIGADYRHWALAGYQAARKAALAEAAQVCEDMHDEDRPGDYAYAIRALEKEQP